MAERADVKTRFKSLGEKPLASSMTAVRLPIEIHLAVRSLKSPSERAAWLRRVISEAAERELISNANQ